jgi:hypothetical protein
MNSAADTATPASSMAFTVREVYDPTLTSGLRLVTCGGQFDLTTDHYRSNIIV